MYKQKDRLDTDTYFPFLLIDEESLLISKFNLISTTYTIWFGNSQ